MSLTDYLAKNYLSAERAAPTKKSKKRKRRAEDNAGLSIADDDAAHWKDAQSAEVDDDGIPVALSGAANEGAFRKVKQSNWKTVGSAAPSHADQKAADDIIAQAQAENRRHAEADLDQPTVVEMDEDEDEDDTPRMASGARAGLQSGAQVSAALKSREDEERRRLQAAVRDPDSKMNETIYRDATGRIVNAKLARAEALREKDDQQRKEQDKKTAVQGEVQKLEAQTRRAQLEDARTLDVARYADDAALNEEQRAVERWNDPAAQFLAKKEAGKSATGKQLYKGSFEVNRYGIRPGHRWDGVERGIGFEQQWFAARSERAGKRDLHYAWQMDE